VNQLHALVRSGHFLADDIRSKLRQLKESWQSLKEKAERRKQDLEDSLQGHQYLADANEAESWMKEKEPIVGSYDYGRDEDSAEVLATHCSPFTRASSTNRCSFPGAAQEAHCPRVRPGSVQVDH